MVKRMSPLKSNATQNITEVLTLPKCHQHTTWGVLGASKTGLSVTQWLLSTQADTKVWVSQASPFSPEQHATLTTLTLAYPDRLRYESGEHSEAWLNGIQCYVVSPGIPPHTPIIKALQAKDLPAYTDLDLAFLASQPLADIYPENKLHWIYITGTNGKTTTTSLLAHMLHTLGYTAKVGGNIGTPVLESLTKLIPAWQDTPLTPQKPTFMIVEASSYQLHYTTHAKPWICVHTNLQPDHLSWHGGFEAYLEAKGKLFKTLGNEAALWVLPVADPLTQAILKDEHPKTRKVTLTPSGKPIPSEPHQPITYSNPSHDGYVTIHTQETTPTLAIGTVKTSEEASAQTTQLVSCERFQLKGFHNLQNLAQCLAVCQYITGVYQEATTATMLEASFEAFQGVAHRLSPLPPTRHGHVWIHWFNDSKATNPEASQAGLEALLPDIIKLSCPLFMLVGGADKGTPLTSWCQTVDTLMSHQAKSLPLKGGVYLYGEAQERFATALATHAPKVKVQRHQTLEEACTHLVEQVSLMSASLMPTSETNAPNNAIVYAVLSPACASFDQFKSFEHRGEVFEAWVKQYARSSS
jgi:UDP-N-acetylmuramoylalanine--D-glutamate ligase